MKYELTRELSIMEVPDEVIDELTEKFGSAEFDLGSSITEATQTMLADYQPIGETIERGVVIDPQTYAPMAAEGNVQAKYHVRLDIVEDGVIVRAVIKQNNLVNTVIHGPFEPLNTSTE